jgi:hypothetical protein
MMNCAEFEVLLADFLDGALHASGREAERDSFAQHLASCPACAAMEQEVRGVLAFMEVAAEPELPQPLIGKILHATNSGWELQLRGQGIRGWLNRKFAPVLKPRYVMGAMLTVMSLTMLTRCAGGSKATMTAADLDPVRIWSSLDSRGHRIWDRTVKGYESLRVVYEIRTQMDDWNRQQAADAEADADAKADSRKLPGPEAGQPDKNTGAEQPAAPANENKQPQNRGLK